MTKPFFSVVVPVRDGAAHLGRSLRALRRSTFTDWELIVVDDGSTDGSAEVARAMGEQVLTTDRQGRVAARNLGARAATGEYVLYVDADCEVHPDTLEKAAAVLRAEPHLDGLFGSYDDSPAAPGLVSQFKNLLHHHVHQGSREEASTFWTGCGALRRATLQRLGGFRGVGPRRHLEDVELGLRLRAAEGRMRLAKQVQVTHLKAWTLADLLRTDILGRALPWARLIAENGGLVDELNLRRRERLSAGLVAALALTPILSIGEPRWLAALPLLAAGLLWLNRELYTFFRRRRGGWFAAAAIPLHWLYFFYSVVGLGLGLAITLLRSSCQRLTAGRSREERRAGRSTPVLGSGLDFRVTTREASGNDPAA